MKNPLALLHNITYHNKHNVMNHNVTVKEKIMAREATITFEQVAAAADSIKAQGGKASARAVREVLGSGSMATVLKLLQQWQSGQVRQSASIDDTLDPSVVRAISNQIATRVQEATADTTARLADLQAEADLIIAENERQAVDLEAQAAELVVLHGQYAELAGRAQQLESEAARTAAELVAERRATEAARVELAKAELRLEAVPKVEAEIEKVRAELLLARAQAAELHEAAAVATVKLEGAVRELAVANEAVTQARAEAQRFSEAAAELRGQLSTEKIKD
jgi:chromosome segregation ATPase